MMDWRKRKPRQGMRHCYFLRAVGADVLMAARCPADITASCRRTEHLDLLTCIGKLFEEQFARLELPVNHAPAEKPVRVSSHVPLLDAYGLLDGNNENSADRASPGARTHDDERRTCNPFWQKGSINTRLSGHSHQIEDLRFHGNDYLNHGTISGSWWNGAYMDTPYGHLGLILNANGSLAPEVIEH